jgi:succinyl-diaminopimelate desuccinylase
MNLTQIIEAANNYEQEVAELCSELVKRESAHPKGNTDECVAYIQKYFEKNQIENQVYQNVPSKPNIVGRIKGTEKTKVLWVGHLDVVPEGKPENWEYPPYSGEITNGIIHGRGSSDMKGACAAAMVSAKILNQLDQVPNNVEFWFTSDEEVGGTHGAKWLAESGYLSGDICIIGDGNGGGLENPSIDIGCKGSARVKLIANGQTAHGSTPFLGDNAINKLIKAIPWVEKISEYRLDLPPELEEPIKSSIKYYTKGQELTQKQIEGFDRLFNYPSVSCNIIEGGVKINVVPDYAEAQFDIRLTPGAPVYKVRQRVQELVEESKITGLEIKPNPRNESNKEQTAGYFEPMNTPFANQFSKIVEKVTDKEPMFKILTGGTDGTRISKETSIPCLGYGTSITGQAHQPNEYITIENLVLGIKIYTGLSYSYDPMQPSQI